MDREGTHLRLPRDPRPFFKILWSLDSPAPFSGTINNRKGGANEGPSCSTQLSPKACGL